MLIIHRHGGVGGPRRSTRLRKGAAAADGRAGNRSEGGGKGRREVQSMEREVMLSSPSLR